jgi:hypothetical protein
MKDSFQENYFEGEMPYSINNTFGLWDNDTRLFHY